jgi:hypothetical protein
MEDNNKNKLNFAQFVDTLKRWYGAEFDKLTLSEMLAKSLSEGFVKEDYTYCLNILSEETKNKWKVNPIDVYRLCKESKKRRLKEEKYEETRKMLAAPVNKEGRERVKMYLSRITGSLKR